MGAGVSCAFYPSHVWPNAQMTPSIQSILVEAIRLAQCATIFAGLLGCSKQETDLVSRCTVFVMANGLNEIGEDYEYTARGLAAKGSFAPALLGLR